MQTIRRLYIYIMLAVSLTMTAVGAIMLLEIGIDQFWTAIGGRDLLDQSSADLRRQLSLAIPFILIAGPIWLLHWKLAGRTTSVEDERQSWVRAAFFVIAAGFSGLVLLTSLIFVVRSAVEYLFDMGGEVYGSDVVSTVAVLLVAAAVWTTHVWFQRRDARATTLAGPASWLPRLYVYFASGVGVVLLVTGLAMGIEALAQWLLDVPPERPGETWWHISLADALSSIVPGLLIWGLHWRYITSLVRAESPGSATEGSARIRLVYLVGFLMFGVVMTIVRITGGFEEVGRAIADVRNAPEMSQAIRLAVTALFASLPFIGAWLLHREFLLRDGRRAAAQGEGLLRAIRLENYGATLVGLGFAAVSAAILIGNLFQYVLDGTKPAGLTSDAFRSDLGLFGSMLIVGGAVWGFGWLRVRDRLAEFGADEQSSVVRRLYLFIVLGGAGVPLIVSAAFILYRLMERALGVSVESSEFLTQLRLPVGIVIAAVLVAAYHGVLLLRDLRVAPLEFPGRAAVPVELATAQLRLTYPVGTDVDRLLGKLQDQLPDDARLERIDQETRAPEQDTLPPMILPGKPIEAT